jgi:hypothetical protein
MTRPPRKTAGGPGRNETGTLPVCPADTPVSQIPMRPASHNESSAAVLRRTLPPRRPAGRNTLKTMLVFGTGIEVAEFGLALFFGAHRYCPIAAALESLQSSASGNEHKPNAFGDGRAANQTVDALIRLSS